MDNAEQVDILDEYTDYLDPTEYIDYDDDEWEPICVDDCELCGCHGECDPEDPWRWAFDPDEEMYAEADSVPYEEWDE